MARIAADSYVFSSASLIGNVGHVANVFGSTLEHELADYFLEMFGGNDEVMNTISWPSSFTVVDGALVFRIDATPPTSKLEVSEILSFELGGSEADVQRALSGQIDWSSQLRRFVENLSFGDWKLTMRHDDLVGFDMERVVSWLKKNAVADINKLVTQHEQEIVQAAVETHRDGETIDNDMLIGLLFEMMGEYGGNVLVVPIDLPNFLNDVATSVSSAIRSMKAAENEIDVVDENIEADVGREAETGDFVTRHFFFNSGYLFVQLSIEMPHDHYNQQTLTTAKKAFDKELKSIKQVTAPAGIKHSPNGTTAKHNRREGIYYYKMIFDARKATDSEEEVERKLKSMGYTENIDALQHVRAINN